MKKLHHGESKKNAAAADRQRTARKKEGVIEAY